MLTDDDRRTTIERIALHLERFDDDTLREMDRLTDPGERDVRPLQPADYTRRRLLLAFAAGAGSVGVAALGLSRMGDTARASDEELARLRALDAWTGEMDAVELDATVGQGLDAVGAALADTELAAGRLAEGLRDVGPFATAALQLIDPDLADRLRERVLEPADDLVVGVGASIDTWSGRLEQPVRDGLARRGELRVRRADFSP